MSASKNLKLEVVLAAVDKITRPLKAAMAGNQGLARAVKETRDQIRQLNRTQGQIDSFRKVSRDAAITANQLKAAQQRVTLLAQEMAKVEHPTKAMSKAFETAVKEAQALKQRQGELNDRLNTARGRLELAGISTKSLSIHQRELKQQLTATSQALKQQEERLARVNQRQQKMQAVRVRLDRHLEYRDKVAGAGGSMAAAGTLTGATMALPIKSFAQAEDSSTQLKVAMMGAGGVVKKEFAQVNALAEKLGNQLPGTTSDFQDMMKVLIQKGMDAKIVLGGAGEATAKLAVLTNTSFTESADAISVFQDSMGVLDKDMVAAADQMQRLYNVGMKVSDIQEGFKAMGPALAYVRKGGIDAVKALGPLLAITDAAGMDAGSAGNAYNKIIRGSVDAKKVDKANGVLKGTGVKLDFVDKKGNFAGIDNMVKQIMKLQGLSDQQRKTVIETIFGSDKEVAEALNALGKAGNAGIAAMRKKLADQASLQERVKAQLGTLKNLWDASSGTFTNAMVKLGEAIAPEVKALTEWIGTMSERLGAWAKENPALANTLMKIAAAAAIVLTVLGGLTLTLATVMGPMMIVRAGFSMLGIGLGSGIGVLGKFGQMFLWLGRIFLANPIGLVITGIAAAAYYVWSNWGTLGPKFQALWSGIKGAFGAAWDWIKGKVMAVANTIGSFLMNWTIVGFIAQHWEDIKAITFAVWSLLKNMVVGIGQGIVSFFMNWTLPGVIVRHWGTISATASAAWQWVKAQAVAAGQGIASFFMNWTLLGVIVRNWDSITSFMSGLVSRFMTIGAQIMDGLVNGFMSGITRLKNAVNSVGESTIALFKEKLGIHSPSRVFAELGGFTMAGLDQGLRNGQGAPLSTIKQTARKLTAAGTGLALAAAPALAGQLDTRPPIRTAAPAVASAPAANINITINAAPGMDERQLAQLVAREIERNQRQQEARGRSRLTDRD